MIKEISRQMVDAMKNRNGNKLTVLRGIKAQINNFAIAKKQKPENLSEQDIISVLKKEVKKCQDSIDIFSKSDRTDLIEKEKFCLNTISSFLPEQISGGELETLVSHVIRDTGAESIKQLGAVISESIKRAKGRADSKDISIIAKKLLS